MNASLTLATLLFLTVSAQAQSSGPLPTNWPVNRNLLPRYTQILAAGKNEAVLKNPSQFAAVVQVRSGDKAIEFTMNGKETKTVKVPNGEYTIFLRFKNTQETLVGRSFSAENGTVKFEDGGSDTLLGSRQR